MMEAKKVALVGSLILVLILTIDFASRLVWSVDIDDDKNAASETTQSKGDAKASMLTVEQVETLLAWSDVKPTPEQVAAQKAAEKAAAPEPPPPPPKVDVHQQVREAIAGDVSKRLIGDTLLTLRGVFFDKQRFAVVEVENIMTKEKHYYRVALDQSFEQHKLVEIGKNHVVIKHGDSNIKLQMFEGAL